MLHCYYIAYCNRNILLAAGTEQHFQSAKCLKVHNGNMYTWAITGRFKIQDPKHTGNTVVQNPANDFLVYSPYIIPIEDFITFHNLLNHRQGIFYCVFYGKTKPKQNQNKNRTNNQKIPHPPKKPPNKQIKKIERKLKSEIIQVWIAVKNYFFFFCMLSESLRKAKGKHTFSNQDFQKSWYKTQAYLIATQNSLILGKK